MIKTASSGWLVASSKKTSGKGQGASMLLGVMLMSSVANAAEISRPDLPSPAQVERALDEHLLVLNAASNLKMEQANQRKWNSGPYEFNLRAGTAQRNVIETGQRLAEWDVALERPFRLPNKAGMDRDIGAASVEKAQFMLGDAHHEAARLLLKLWFNWQREHIQITLWEQQAKIYTQQAQMTEKRLKAGDAPRLELNQARAAAAQAGVSLHQVELRALLAGNELMRAFPAIQLPDKLTPVIPVAVEHNLAYWNDIIFDDNHELGMIEAQARVQQLLAARSRADRIPDPTLGIRYASDRGGAEKLTGIYVSVPLSITPRQATSDGAEQQAVIAADQEAFVRRRLKEDVYAAYFQAVKNFETWQLARDAAQSIRSNAELMARAYQLGEASLSDSLTAQRLALESSLTENMAQLDANETRYRLMLDAHQLWAPVEEHHHD